MFLCVCKIIFPYQINVLKIESYVLYSINQDVRDFLLKLYGFSARYLTLSDINVQKSKIKLKLILFSQVSKLNMWSDILILLVGVGDYIPSCF